MSKKSSENRTWPLIMSFIRIPLLFLGLGIVMFIYRLSGTSVGFFATSMGWNVPITNIVNFICIGLLLWRSKVEGFHLKELIGFDRSRLFHDVLMGIAYSTLLFIPYMLGGLVIGLPIYLLSGSSIEQIFALNADFIPLPALWILLLNLPIFLLLNSTVEELQYRGYAQGKLLKYSGKMRIGLLIPALGFGIQHTAYASTLLSAPIFVGGFFL